MNMLDAVAVIYAYVLNFIILGIIAIAIHFSARLLVKRNTLRISGIKEAASSPSTTTEVAPKAVVPTESSTTSMKEKVAAAVAAVVTYLATQVPKELEGAGISTSARLAISGWVHQWRSQINTSFNELSMMKMRR